MNDSHLDSERQHFEQLSRWLEMESEAEVQRLVKRRERFADKDVESTGETLLDLVVIDHQTGVGGLFLLSLTKRTAGRELPWNRLRVGTPVVLSSMDDQGGEARMGVVSRRTASLIQVAVDEWPDGDLFRLDLSSDERTRRQQQATLGIVQQARGRLGELRKTLLGSRPPQFGQAVSVDVSPALNASQREAVEFALTAEDLAIIHGPPGTGKTTTVVELIRQVTLREEQVLACAPSNTAVDNLVERLANAGLRVVRLGHPARVAEELRTHTLDGRVENHPDMKIVKKLMSDAEKLFRKSARFTRARRDRRERQAIRNDARQLKADARRLERQVVQHILDRSDVICATTSLDDELLGDRSFPWVIIDEACQSTEPACWVPLLRADRLVLAGDHCQLPPTIISTEAARQGFARSLLERTIEIYGPNATRRLGVQYRMHEHIMDFSSQQFYDGELVAHESVQTHRLVDLVSTPPDDGLLEDPVTFIDTAGAGWEEELEPDGESRRNPQEAALVLKKVEAMVDAGIEPRDIAVIAPYAAQVRWLRQRRNHDELEVDTVDGFQGREKEAIIITLVRSNTTSEIGFLSDTRRTNVALTRARRKLVVIGDSATLGGHPFYSELLEYFESIGAYRSVWEETEP